MLPGILKRKISNPKKTNVYDFEGKNITMSFYISGDQIYLCIDRSGNIYFTSAWNNNCIFHVVRGKIFSNYREFGLSYGCNRSEEITADPSFDKWSKFKFVKKRNGYAIYVIDKKEKLRKYLWDASGMLCVHSDEYLARNWNIKIT